MARNPFGDTDVLESVDDFGDVLTDAELEELENLSSDLDRWEEDSFDADRDYLYGLLR